MLVFLLFRSFSVVQAGNGTNVLDLNLLSFSELLELTAPCTLTSNTRPTAIPLTNHKITQNSFFSQYEGERNVDSTYSHSSKLAVYKAAIADLSHSSTDSIDILRFNYAPIFPNINRTIDENQKDTIDALSNVTDPDGDLSISLVSVTASNSANAWLLGDQVIYQPNPGFVGLDTLTITVTDNNGGYALGFVYYNVLSAYTEPISFDKYIQVLENTPTDIELPVSGVEDMEAVELIIEQAPKLGTYTCSSLSLSYTPQNNTIGYDTISYYVKDLTGLISNTSYIYIDIQRVSSIPILSDIRITHDEDVSTTVNVFDALLYAGTEPLTLVNVTNGASVTGQISDSSVTIIPNSNYYGSDVLQYTLKNVSGDFFSATIYVEVQSVNDAPVALDDSYEATHLELDYVPAMILHVADNDSDIDESPLQGEVRIVQYPFNGTISNDSPLTFSYIPNDDFVGEDEIIYILVDSLGATSNEATVTITIEEGNYPPIVVNDTNTMNEDNDWHFNPLSNDSDPQGEFIWASLETTRTLHGVLNNTDDILWTYHPDTDFYGDDSIMYVCHDEWGYEVEGWIIVEVLPVNDYPRLVRVTDTLYYHERSGWQFVTDDVTVSDVDSDGLLKAEVTFSSSTLGTWDVRLNRSDVDIVRDTISSKVRLTMTATSFTFDDWQDVLRDLEYINTSESGDRVNNVSVKLWDSSTTYSENRLANILPVYVQNKPVLADQNLEMMENASIDFEAIITEGDSINFTTIVVEQAPKQGSYTINGQYVTYTPTTATWGYDTIAYCLYNADGVPSNTAYAYIQIRELTKAPLLKSIHLTIDEDGQGNVHVSEMLFYAGTEPISLTSVHSSSNVVGEIQDSTVAIIPNIDFHGKDTLEYSFKTTAGDIFSDTIYVEVLPINDNPVAISDSYTRTNYDLQNTPYLVLPVTYNDYDIDEESFLGKVQIVGKPIHGTVTNDTSMTLLYTPVDDFIGRDSFIYILVDTLGAESNQALVNITVNAVNFAPVAVNDTAYILEDTTWSFNPLDNDYDVQYDSLSAVLEILRTEHGIIDVSDGNHWVYTPDANYYGDDSALYICNDEYGSQTEGWIIIHIAPVNDLPQITRSTDTLYYKENSDWQFIGEDIKLDDIEGDVFTKAEISFYADTIGTWEVRLNHTAATVDNYIIEDTVRFVITSTTTSLLEWQSIINAIEYRNTSSSDCNINTVTAQLWDSDTTYADELLVHIKPEYVNEAPVNITLPTITGTAYLDSTLLCNTGDWIDTDGQLSYAWHWYYLVDTLEFSLGEQSTSTLLITDEIADADAIWCKLIATDNGFPLPAKLTIAYSDTVSPPGYRPSSLSISNDEIFYSLAANDTVGILSTSDRDSGQTHTFELLTKNNIFTISDNVLYIDFAADHTGVSGITVSIRVHDNGSPSLYRDFDLYLTFFNDYIPIIQTDYPSLHEVFGDRVEVNIMTNKPGFAIYTVVPSGESVTLTLENFKDSVAFNTFEPVLLPYDGLQSETDYDMVIYTIDVNGEYVSEAYTFSFTTLDITGPIFIDSTPYSVYCGLDSLVVSVSLNEVAQIYFAPQDTSAMSLSQAELIDMLIYTGDSLSVDYPSQLYTVELPYLEVLDTHLVAFVAKDTLGNFSEVIFHECSPIDSVPSTWIDDYPILHGINNGSVEYSAAFTECGTIMTRICNNFDSISDFSADANSYIFALDTASDDNCSLAITTEELSLDGIYRIDIALMDEAGNLSEVRSISFEYPIAIDATLTSSIVYRDEAIKLSSLSSNADYSIIDMNGNLVQSGTLDYNASEIPFSNDFVGLFIVKLSSPTGHKILRILKTSSTSPQ